MNLPALVLSALAPATVLAAGVRDATEPHVWQPGLISGTLHDAAPAFLPDGDTVYFGRSSSLDGPLPVICVSRLVDGAWKKPEVAPFSGTWGDMEPAIAPDGSHLIFVSNRPEHAGGAMIDGTFNGRTWPGGGGALWRMERTAEGWSAPGRLPDTINAGGATFAPAIASNGALYFMRPDAETGRFRLFRAAWSNGAYGEPEPLPFSDGSSSDVDPAVAPGESFLVFGSGGSRSAAAQDMDLFIVFRQPDGAWGRPVLIGGSVSAPGSDAESRLAPVPGTLYFSSVRRVPGVSADWNNGKYNIWSVRLGRERMAELREASLAATAGDGSAARASRIPAEAEFAGVSY
ncbi:MAG TPA: hypothetical protein VF200_09865 [Woeseiaceae bacterium]